MTEGDGTRLHSGLVVLQMSGWLVAAGFFAAPLATSVPWLDAIPAFMSGLAVAILLGLYRMGKKFLGRQEEHTERLDRHETILHGERPERDGLVDRVKDHERLLYNREPTLGDEDEGTP